MKLRKYRYGSSLRLQAPTFDEQFAKSNLLRQKHDAYNQAFLDAERGLDFEYAAVDEPYVQEALQPLQQGLDNLSTNLATKGIKGVSEKDLLNYRRQYQKSMGPNGVLGKTMQNKAAMQQALSEFDRVHAREPEWYRQKAKQQMLAAYKGVKDPTTGKLQDFTPGPVTGYRDIAGDAIEMLKNAGASDQDLALFRSGHASIQAVPLPNGAQMLKIVEQTPGNIRSNKQNLEAGLNQLLTEYTDVNTDRGRFAQIAEYTPEYIAGSLSNIGNMMQSSVMSRQPGWNASYQQMPDAPNGGGSGGYEAFNPIDRSIVTTHTPMKNSELFKDKSDIKESIRSSQSTYKKSAALDLASQNLTYDMLPDILKSEYSRDNFDPKQVVQDLPKLRIKYSQSLQQQKTGGMGYSTNPYINKEANARLAELDRFENTIFNNAEVRAKSTRGDLAVPMFSFDPSMRNYSQVVSNTNTYLNQIPLEDFEFIGGDLAGKSVKKIKGNDSYKALNKKRELMSVGTERDSGMFFIIKGDDGVEHMVKLKDGMTDNEAKFAELVGRPDLYEAAKYKNYNFEGNKITFNGTEQGNLNFKVKNTVAEDGTRMYQLEGVTLGDYHDNIKTNLINSAQQQYGNNIPPEVNVRIDEIVAREMYDKFKINFDNTGQINWDSPLETTNKATVLEVNQLIKK